MVKWGEKLMTDEFWLSTTLVQVASSNKTSATYSALDFQDTNASHSIHPNDDSSG
jgi:hypothetical protein